jgi:hypothetical protein
MVGVACILEAAAAAVKGRAGQGRGSSRHANVQDRGLLPPRQSAESTARAAIAWMHARRQQPHLQMSGSQGESQQWLKNLLVDCRHATDTAGETEHVSVKTQELHRGRQLQARACPVHKA